jgi:hypothetical protein
VLSLSGEALRIPDLETRLERGTAMVLEHLAEAPLVAREIYLEDYVEEVGVGPWALP